MKRLIPLLSIVFLFIFAASASSYEVQIIGNISLTDTLTGIAVDPSTGIAAAISSKSRTLYLIDTNSNTVTRKIPLDIIPSAIAIDDRRNNAIVSSKEGVLQFIDLTTGKLFGTISTGKEIHSLASPPFNSPLGRGGYVGMNDVLYIGAGGGLIVLDPETGNTLKETPLPYKPIGMAIDTHSGSLVVIGEGKEGFSFYDAGTLEATAEITVGINPSGIAVNPSTQIAIITNASRNSISIVSLENIEENLRKAPSPLPLPTGQAGSPSGGEGYLVSPPLPGGDEGEGVLCALANNCISNISTIPFPDQPRAVAIDPTRNIALIGHETGITVIQLENPIPMIERLIPESSQAGTPGLTLSIEGARFIRDSKARFNLRELDTLFEGNETLRAVVPREELLMPGDVPVTVLNPGPGGGLSNIKLFKIINPVPQIETLTPDTVALTPLSPLRDHNSPYPPLNLRGGAEGGGVSSREDERGVTEEGLSLRVRGKNFLPNAIVNLNGRNLKTRFISSILLEAELNLSDIATPAKYPVTVINPSPVSLVSNVVFLDVVEDETLLSLTDEKDKRKEESTKTTGTLKGRILNTYKQPVEGVRVQIKNIKADTDAGGYFSLNNVPSGKQHLMIHGSTAKDKESKYPTIPLTVNIEPDKVNVMPFQIYLHKQKDKNFKDINPAEDTILTDPEVPGFEMRIPKGVKIIGWDGKPNERVSVRTVPTDRLPVKPLPDNSYIRSIYMFYFGKEGGGVPDQPIPVRMPNDLGLLPGDKAILWYYDESPNEGEAPNDWAIAGALTVSPDGRDLVSDPGTGVPKFCCGATGPGCIGPCPPPPGCKSECCGAGGGSGGSGGGGGGFW